MKILPIAVFITVFLSIAIIIASLALWNWIQLQKMYMIQEILSDPEKFERLRILLKEGTKSRIHLKKADAAVERKSSCPQPTKLRQVLFSLLKAVLPTVASAIAKSLLERFLG